MGEDELVVAELDDVSVVSVLRVEGIGSAMHVYEVHSDGAVLATFPTLKDVFSYLSQEGF